MPKRPKNNTRHGQPDDWGFRSLSLRASTFDGDARSVEATISTETPVMMPDFERMEMVPEVLRADGAEVPKSRQVPFLDSHNRYSVDDQLGSARDVAIEEGQLSARLVFGRTGRADQALSNVQDGHVTDVSVGYEILPEGRTYVPRGEKKKVNGRFYEGPVNVVTKWRLREVSLTPIGADAQAKLRGLDPAAVRFQFANQTKEEFEMNAELRKLLESRGMPADLDDEQAQEWLLRNADKLAEPKAPERKEPETTGLTSERIAELIAKGVRDARAAQIKEDEEFRAHVDILCDLADLNDEREACYKLGGIEKVREHLKTVKTEQEAQLPYGGAIRMGASGVDKLREGLRGALELKAVRSACADDQKLIDKHLPPDQRAKDVDQFRHATLLDMATEFVRAHGVQTFGLTREQIAQCAMFGPEVAGIRNYRGSFPYHTTGSFANLTLDAINKSMMVGYTEAPSTWRGPMRQGESVPDFKQIHRMRLGGVPNLPVWNDTTKPETASMADAKESYAVECRSEGVSFSYKLIVNDDMSALTRVPQSLGDAASRTVNAVAWSQVTSNPTMSDSVALFATATGARKRSNLTTGAGAPSVATVQTLTNLMRQMRGENTPEGNESQDILNLSPTYIIGPSALETTINQLVNSAYDPSSSINTMVYNPTRTLTPVIEPLLDASSATAWYLFASPVRIDTIEVTFLQGQETPQVRSVMDEHTLSMTYYVLQSFGAKPLNHRGVQKHDGA